MFQKYLQVGVRNFTRLQNDPFPVPPRGQVCPLPFDPVKGRSKREFARN